jgi:hypothetical protein
MYATFPFEVMNSSFSCYNEVRYCTVGESREQESLGNKQKEKRRRFGEACVFRGGVVGDNKKNGERITLVKAVNCDKRYSPSTVET